MSLNSNIMEIVPSIAGLRRISSNSSWTAFLQAGLPLGFENIKRTDGSSESNFFIGLNASQCIAFLPLGESGFAFSTGPYESFLMGSELYPYDLGLKVSLGWKY